MKGFINTKKIVLGLLVFGIVMVLTGVSYAWFNFSQTGTNNSLITGDIYLTLNEGTDQISLENVFPMTKEEARSKTNNFITFTLSGLNTSNQDVYYEIKLKYGDDKNGYTRFNDKDLVFDLVEVDSSNNETYVVDAASYDSFNNKRIWVDTVDHNTTTEITKTYKLRVWLNEDVIISDTDPNATYPATGANAYKNHYASVKVSVFGDVNEKEVPGIVNKIKKLKDNGATYIASYDDIIASNPTFTTQDQVSSSATKKTVYYYTGSDAAANSNVLFAGYCWQIVRTTDNGGTRIIYNGVPVNDKCETTRTATKGVNSANATTQNLSSTTTYGTGYTYDVSNSTFTLTGVMNGKSWSSDYADLIGKYTCLGTATSCSTLVSINGYSDSTTAYVAKYTIGDVVHFSQLGTSPFNANYKSLAMVGYMFNKVKKNDINVNNVFPSGAIFGKDVEYNNGSYLVIEDTAGTASENTTNDGEHHYTCGTAGTTSCTKVRFYNYNHYYITLTNGETIESVLKEMLNYKQNSSENDAHINNNNSTIKGYLDNWYNQNLNNSSYTQYLDDTTVYCNNRSVSNLGSWNKTSTKTGASLQFKQNNANQDLNCENETDRFSVSNTKAQLTYPIGLLTEPERNLMGITYAKTDQGYWGGTPSYYFSINPFIYYVGTTGERHKTNVFQANGVRPVLTLRPSLEIEEGKGTYTDPYVIGPKVTRTY